MLHHNSQPAHRTPVPSAKTPTPSQNLHAIAHKAHVRPIEAYIAHGGIPPTPEAIAYKAKNAPSAKATPPVQQYIKRPRPSWWMRHIWPLGGFFVPMRYAIRDRRQYVRDLEWIAIHGEPCVPPWLR